ncbi:cobalamin-binding protein [Mycobacterium kubicae]|uniref:Cobalamin-binding protein n=1 Tax=Mycobacterium kubicae TaxID=120959 RepID=A0AAX1JHF5_9MYCO|nr:cobalamin-dependent protein [Mycobacterium kubicae]MCV7095223.1 cobalamin B12-binding domain-containing protein [Mycobacterium kubicae]ORV95124.1 cobalamin-binding protein [Mycobacterium kubicae]QNI15115.1 cobalamin B12-binding domain-containing protein [Mycobacterium kubicae]QPI41013.1 cobalamin-dependent protein [Mycobacterium kubicae]GFG65864.1 cobalamin-binding protein [Mycobacterium kubicae]
MHDTDTATSRAAAAVDRHLLRERLWGAVIDRDEFAAAATIFAAIDAGLGPEDALLDVIAPVQQKVGAEWAANRITVAQEHAATAINDRVIAALAHHPASRTPARTGRVTVACVDGEWHALPARLLAEVLRLRGWQVDFLGAQVPTPHLVAHLHQHAPDVVALSCSIPTRLPTAHAAITACQAAGVPVLAGGAAFGSDGRYARQLGADAWAPDARAACERLAQEFPRMHLGASRQPIDDLPHLADQEYTMVSRTAPQLVQSTVTELEDRIPAMRAYTEQQRQHTIEDIAHIVDFLGTGLYTDDDDLFTDFIMWTAEILTARGVPAGGLLPALDLLALQLKDFPRSQRLLQGAGDALTATSGAPQ